MKTLSFCVLALFYSISLKVTVNSFDNDDDINSDYLRKFYLAPEDETKLTTIQTTTPTNVHFENNVGKTKTLSLNEIKEVKSALRDILIGRTDMFMDTNIMTNPATEMITNIHHLSRKDQVTTDYYAYKQTTFGNENDHATLFVRKKYFLRNPTRSKKSGTESSPEDLKPIHVPGFHDIQDTYDKLTVMQVNGHINLYPVSLTSSETTSAHNSIAVSRISHTKLVHEKSKRKIRNNIKPTQSKGKRRHKPKSKKPTHTPKRKNKNKKTKPLVSTSTSQFKGIVFRQDNDDTTTIVPSTNDVTITVITSAAVTTPEITTPIPKTTTIIIATTTPEITTPIPKTTTLTITTTTPEITTPIPTTTTVTITTTTEFFYGTTDNRTFEFEIPTTITTTTTTTPRPQFDIPALLDIIANLTYDYETNLTHFVNETLMKWNVPTCATPTTQTPTPPPTTTLGYDYWSNGTGTIMGKCFVCGLEEPGIPYHGYCGDAFDTDFIPLTPVEASARGQISSFRKYCRYLDIVGSYLNASDPKSLWGRWTGGCGVRWMDLSTIYTQRTCRNRNRAMLGKHYLSKRMMKLEMALQHIEDGCVISPVASLVPMSRGINLYARFHACVCTKSWCNSVNKYLPSTTIMFISTFYQFLL